MRVLKNWSIQDASRSTRYRYDGQMGMEDVTIITGMGGQSVEVTRYVLGARGIDYLEKVVDGGNPSEAFPVYDGHGNMVATLARNGLSYTVGNRCSFDAWGSVRLGSQTDDLSTRIAAVKELAKTELG